MERVGNRVDLEPVGAERKKELRAHFWIGIALLVLGNILIFARIPGGAHLRPFSDYWFALVWFGYIFVVDALVCLRDGRSLIVSARRLFLAMLPLSAAIWWGFEGINAIVHNWNYIQPHDIPNWYASLVSCVFFSTVIPAVWETADWIRGSQMIRRVPLLRGFKVAGWVPRALTLLGVLFLILACIWPRYFFPLIWGFLALILDPINFSRGRPSMLGTWARGNWRTPLAFYVAGLACGFLWEFWNYWAFPKWYYTIPYVGFAKVFEMPLLGYLGYGPFAWELFTVFWIVVGFAPGQRRVDDLGLPPLDSEEAHASD